MLRNLLKLAVICSLLVSNSFAEPFTYQGSLRDDGQRADGTYDVSFGLFPDSGGSGSIGSVCVDNVIVTDGLFSVELDFGDSAFDGSERFLELSVRRDTGQDCSLALETFTTLSPRQKIQSSPQAFFAQQAAEVIGGTDDADADPQNEIQNLGSVLVQGSDASGAGISNLGSVSASDFTGDGSALTNLSVSSLDAANGGPVDAVIVDETGRVGIGLTSPDATLDIMGDLKLNGSTVLDQSMDSAGLNLICSTCSQSFTAGESGFLTAFEIVVQRNNEASSGTLTVYDGEGTSGEVLFTEPYEFPVFPGASTRLRFQPEQGIPIVQGQKYTMSFRSGSGTKHRLTGVFSSDLYPDGEAIGFDPADLVDFTFATFVSDVPATGIVFPDGTRVTTAPKGDGHSLDGANDGPVDALFIDEMGNVGIGTSTPSSRAEVLGKLTLSGEDEFLHRNSAAPGFQIESPIISQNFLVFQGPKYVRSLEVSIASNTDAKTGVINFHPGFDATTPAIHSVPFTIPGSISSDTTITFPIEPPVLLLGGGAYTFSFVTDSGDVTWNANTGDPVFASSLLDQPPGSDLVYAMIGGDSPDSGLEFPDGTIQTTALTSSSIQDADADPANELQDLASVLNLGSNGDGVSITNLGDVTATSFSGDGSGLTGINSLSAEDGNPVNGLFVDSEGNVGIGTTTPQPRVASERVLEIRGILPQILLDDVNGNDVDDFRIANGGANVGFQDATDNIEIMTLSLKGDNNVGIGNISPLAKLDVDGSLRLTGGNSSALLDQENPALPLFTISDTQMGQSFTAQQTGLLTSFKVGLININDSRTGTLTIYEGNGRGGTVLTSQPYFISDKPQTDFFLQEFVLLSDVPVTSGSQYTFDLSSSGGNIEVGASISDFYPAGEYIGSLPGFDSIFQTFVAAERSDGIHFPDGTFQKTAFDGDRHSLDAADGFPTDAVVIDNDGNTGIGTTNPRSTLEVAGQFRLSPSDNSGALDQANNPGASVALPTSILSQSFETGASGFLTEIRIFVDSANLIPAGTLTIYEGSGNGGNVLGVQDYSVPVSPGITTEVAFILNDVIPVISGQVYTFRFETSGGDSRWRGTTGNQYPDGVAFLFSADIDTLFEIYVSDEPRVGIIFPDGTVQTTAFTGPTEPVFQKSMTDELKLKDDKIEELEARIEKLESLILNKKQAAGK